MSILATAGLPLEPSSRAPSIHFFMLTYAFPITSCIKGIFEQTQTTKTLANSSGRGGGGSSNGTFHVTGGGTPATRNGDGGRGSSSSSSSNATNRQQIDTLRQSTCFNPTAVRFIHYFAALLAEEGWRPTPTLILDKLFIHVAEKDAASHSVHSETDGGVMIVQVYDDDLLVDERFCERAPGADGEYSFFKKRPCAIISNYFILIMCSRGPADRVLCTFRWRRTERLSSGPLTSESVFTDSC